MKILVIQLLRLGDIVTSAPVAKALKDVHPDSKIHFLINSQFSSVKPLIPYVDQFIGFNRSKLQRKIVSKDVSFFAAFRGFKSLVEHLKNEKYDLVINLTQNRLSGYLVGILNPTQSLGLQLNGKSSVKFGATQFQFLNWHGLSKDISTPHYIDIYLDALKTQSVQRKIILKETRSGFEEAKKIVQNQDIDLLIQPLTSDKKKNWGLDKFKVFIENYLKMNPSHRIGILGAPPEKKQLQNFVGDLNSDQIFLCITSLEGALSLIKKSKVLLTLDTSIKHIASTTAIRIVELSLGSSHLQHTGVYRKNAYIIQANIECAPCGHSTDCPYVTNICRDKIDPAFIANFMSAVYDSDNLKIDDLAKITTNSIYKIQVEPNLGYFATPLNFTTKSIFDSVLGLKNRLRINSEKGGEVYQEFYKIMQDKADISSLVDLYQQIVKGIDNLKESAGAFSLLHRLQTNNYYIQKLTAFYLRENNMSHLTELQSPQSVLTFVNILNQELDFIEFVLLQLIDQKLIDLNPRNGGNEWKKNKHSKNYLPL